MAPEILTVMTPDAQQRAPEPLIYHRTVRDTRIDPREPWYPCGCPHQLDDIHVDDCWLDWLAYSPWMTDDTQVIDGIGQQLTLVASDVDDEDESTYHERHDAELRDDDLDEEVTGGEV